MDSESQRLRMLIEHWIEHNDEHNNRFRETALKAVEMQLVEVSNYLYLAAARGDEVTEYLKKARELLKD